MNSIPDNAIVVGVTVTVSYSLVRRIDIGGDPRRKVLKQEHLRVDAIGSDALMNTLPAELHRIGGVVIHNVQKWEGKAKVKAEAEALK